MTLWPILHPVAGCTEPSLISRRWSERIRIGVGVLLVLAVVSFLLFAAWAKSLQDCYHRELAGLPLVGYCAK